MKKYLIISSFLLMISSFCIICYFILEAKQEVTIEKNLLQIQKEKEAYLTPYGYTMEDANIVLNPYDISPLTALILFETTKEEEITVIIKGKDETTNITNTFVNSKTHYIPIYGLYPDTENEIILKTNKKEVKYKIKTSPLPTDLQSQIIVNYNDDMTFLNYNNYIYAQDKNNDIRWYLEGEYKYNITKLKNENYLISTSTLNTEGFPIGIMEIDLLGKIYKQYNIENGYHGKVIENNDSYYILSKDLIEIDKQTGYILNKTTLKDEYNDITYNETNNVISLLNAENTLSINLLNKEEITLNETNDLFEKEITSKLYTNNNNYKIVDNILFNLVEENKQSKQKIFLIGYKKTKDLEKKYNIEIVKNDSYLKITGDFKKKEVYLILDKFMDKRIYDINSDYTIINSIGLSDKYNIYLKIEDNLYKTNQYVIFNN